MASDARACPPMSRTQPVGIKRFTAFQFTLGLGDSGASLDAQVWALPGRHLTCWSVKAQGRSWSGAAAAYLLANTQVAPVPIMMAEPPSRPASKMRTTHWGRRPPLSLRSSPETRNRLTPPATR